MSCRTAVPQETCLACDRTQWRWKQPPELFAGQVAVFSQVVIDDDRVNVQDVDGEYMFQFRGTITQGGCLLPWSNIVKDLQDAGALAVIFINRTLRCASAIHTRTSFF